jgi:hypothetical protein
VDKFISNYNKQTNGGPHNPHPCKCAAIPVTLGEQSKTGLAGKQVVLQNNWS